MAVTSIMPIKYRVDKIISYAKNPKKTTAEIAGALHSLNGTIDYAKNDFKTEKCTYVSVLNCSSAENAAEEFMETKQIWGKTDGRVCYHIYQSFAEGEVDADTAHKIGVKLAENLYGKRFQVLIATHLNTAHYHNHIIVNSVSDVDGYKFYNSPSDLEALRNESDRLCKEYGLSIVENPGKTKTSYAEWKAEQRGEFTIRGGIRAAIETSIAGSTSFTEFIGRMDTLGYEIDLNRKYPRIRHIGNDRYVRFDTLGEGYTIDEIRQRIFENDHPRYPKIPEQDDPMKIFPDNERVANMHLYKLYGIYVTALNITIERPKENRNMYFLLREEHRKLQSYKAQLRILGTHKIKTAEDLFEAKQEFKKQYDEIYSIRKDWKNVLKRDQRNGDEKLIREAYFNIDIANRKLKDLRAEIKACDDIAERTPGVKKRLTLIENGIYRASEAERFLENYELKNKRKVKQIER